jgi:hypothetical protein
VYQRAFELISDTFAGYWPQYDQSFHTNVFHIMAGRMRDIIYIKSNYPETGALQARHLSGPLNATFPGREKDAGRIASTLLHELIEFLRNENNSPRDL